MVWQDYRDCNWDIYGLNISSPSILPMSSRKRLLFLDYLYLFLTVASTAGGALIIRRGFRRRTEIMQESVLSAFEAHDFRRRVTFISWSVFLVGFLPLGLILLSSHIKSLPYVIIAVMSTFLVADLWWQAKTPYVRITDDKIILFSGVLSQPRVAELHAIKGIVFDLNETKEFDTDDEGDQYIWLYLKSNETIIINLSCLKKNGRPLLIKALKQFDRARQKLNK